MSDGSGGVGGGDTGGKVRGQIGLVPAPWLPVAAAAAAAAAAGGGDAGEGTARGRPGPGAGSSMPGTSRTARWPCGGVTGAAVTGSLVRRSGGIVMVAVTPLPGEWSSVTRMLWRAARLPAT